MANPNMPLRGIGGQLEAMKIRTAAGSMVGAAASHLLRKAPPTAPND